MVEPPAREGLANDDLRLDALAYKMVGSLLVLAGVLLLGALAALLQFDPVLRDGVRAFAVPGTNGRHVLDAGAMPVLAWSGGVLSVLGVGGLMLARAKVRRPVLVSVASRTDRPSRPLWRSVLILALGLAVLAAVIYGRRP